MKDNIQNLHIEKGEKATITITGEIVAPFWESFRQTTINTLGKDISIAGFRKGAVPEKVLIKEIGEHNLLSEMAEQALKQVYPYIITENKLDPIGMPQVMITKLATGNPLGFKIETAIFPEITLPDCKKISKEIFDKREEVTVTDKEVEDAILHIRTMYAKQKQTDEERKENKTPTLPEITDDFVKTLGEFKDTADFKEKVRASIKTDKENQAHESKRIALADKLIADTDIAVPEVLVESEIEKMLSQLKDRIAQAQMKWNEYLTHAKKSEVDIRNEIKPEAEKRTRLNIILAEIAKKENIIPDKKRLEKEIAHIKEHHKDAHEENVRAYVTHILTNEAVFAFLEGENK